ncbi:DUF3656 domain-containing protein [Bengtsoniella intestinalis]|uniref:U32 family peptidase n=1 Tax=Bengtsoniella intestinalis TaxID=3073143 RepID=UPI00391FA2B6
MKPELLAPVGSPEALQAAVQHGADAVFLGWGDFNARRNAKNFSDEDFANAIAYCHFYGVKVFLTLNTLLTDRELPAALAVATMASELGIDAILVQDWGLFALLKEALPDQPLHASTQMSIFTSGGANLAVQLGLRRVVLARECSKEDIRTICATCEGEVEVFVHGALCMCYSGQCAMSAAVGGRSGNRGKCAQPCRLPYGINEPVTDNHPLSLKDNALGDFLPELEDMGVACLKLEGRMKRAEYVGVITSIYAKALQERRKLTAQEWTDLTQAFSRDGFTQDYWNGTHGRQMMGMRPEGAAVPKELFATIRQQYEKENLRLVNVHLSIDVLPKQPVSLTAWDDMGNTVTVIGDIPEAARNRAITQEDVCGRLAKTGGSGFICAEAIAHVGDGLSLSAATINGLRRDALAQLRAQITTPPVRTTETIMSTPCHVEASHLDYTISVSSLSQLSSALLDLQPARVYIPLELLAQADNLPSYTGQYCAILPRVWRDYDEPLFLQWIDHAKALGVTGLLLGNLGHFPLCQELGMDIYGDYGLNVFNARAMDFLAQRGLQSATVSFELRGAQIRDMQKPIAAEALVYGRLPLMITENCLSQNGRLNRCNPSAPHCTREEIPYLSDRTGAQFPVLSAYGHRSEIQNSKPLFLADRDDYKQLGLRFGRLRFTTESPLDCVRILQAYQQGGDAPDDFTRGLFDRGVE